MTASTAGSVVRSATRVALRTFAFACAIAFFGIGLLPHVLPYRTLTVLSGSMRPAFSAGSIVIVTPESIEDVRAGHVITYIKPIADHGIVSHRVVAVHRSGGAVEVQTQGDANAAPDPWTARIEQGPVWRVRARVAGLGYLIAGLRNPALLRALMYGAPALLVFQFLVSLWSTSEAPVAPVAAAATMTPPAGRRRRPAVERTAWSLTAELAGDWLTPRVANRTRSRRRAIPNALPVLAAARFAGGRSAAWTRTDGPAGP